MESHCLICSSSINKSNNKLDNDSDLQSFSIFLFYTVLEIPSNEVKHLQEKLINQQLNTIYCKSCQKLISSAKQVYTQILELSQKFRRIQKQIVGQISSSVDLHGGVPLSTTYRRILHFCGNFLNKHDFNEFGHPFIVAKIPEPEANVKEEPISEDDAADNDSDYQPIGVDCQLDEEDLQNPSISSADQEDDPKNDSDFEPTAPPSRKTTRKAPIKKPPSSSSSPKKKRKRKSLSPSSPASPSASSSPPRKKKSIPPIKQSRFELRYPDYPKLLKDPTTNKFHCSEPFCSKNYPSKAALETHILIQHLQDNFYKCEEPSCGKSYAQREHFEDHASWHAGIPRWKCEDKVTTTDGETLQCTEQFFCRKKLNRHVQQVHQHDKQFICEICGSNFSCQDYLTVHKYSKHRDNPKEEEGSSETTSDLICNYCGKTFNVRATLNVHINLVHEKTVGEFPCQFCEYKFIAKNCLKMHLWRVHKFKLEGYQPPKSKNKIEDQPYRCEVTGCKVGFQKEQSLRKHMEERHGEGQDKQEEHFKFNCKYCGKGFHLRRVLDNHERAAHENKESKPFSCEICGKEFAILRYVNMHKRNAHKIGCEKGAKK